MELASINHETTVVAIQVMMGASVNTRVSINQCAQPSRRVPCELYGHGLQRST